MKNIEIPLIHQERFGINLIGLFKCSLGLGETARLFASSLKVSNIPHTLISADFVVPHLKKINYSENLNETPLYNINLFCVGFDRKELAYFLYKKGSNFVKGRKNILIFFWETSHLSKEREKLLQHFDEIWVCSLYVKDIVSKYVSVPVRLIPHPLDVDQEIFPPNKAQFGLSNDFMFLFCFDYFSSIERKNPQGVIQAFRMAFPREDDVQLVLKTSNSIYFPRDEASLKKMARNDNRIHFIDSIMTKDDIKTLMCSADCYISLHRSEGYGLTIAESLLYNKPVISTAYSGNMEYMNSSTNLLVDFNLQNVYTANPRNNFSAYWANPDLNKAAMFMRKVKNRNPQVFSGKCLFYKNTYVNVGNLISDYLKQMQNSMVENRMFSSKLQFMRFIIEQRVKMFKVKLFNYQSIFLI